jgi:hypothetical protein
MLEEAAAAAGVRIRLIVFVDTEGTIGFLTLKGIQRSLVYFVTISRN